MDWKSVPKCGRPKQVLLELANDVTFLGAQAFMTGLLAGCRAEVAGVGLSRKDGTKNLLDRLTLAPRQQPKQANRGVHVWMDSVR